MPHTLSVKREGAGLLFAVQYYTIYIVSSTVCLS